MFRPVLFASHGSTIVGVPVSRWEDASATVEKLTATDGFTGGNVEEKVEGIGWVLANDPAETYCQHCDTFAPLIGNDCLCGRVNHSN